MTLTLLFIISGTVLAAMVLAKRMEERGGKQFFILKAVSKGDSHARDLYHKALHVYSHGKDKAAFFVKKRLPMRSKHSINKFLALLSEQARRYLGDIRGSKLIKRSDGISEFFKNLSVEKGSGEINETYEDLEIKPEPAKEPEPAVIMSTFKPKPPRKPRKKAPAKKKLVVTVEK